MKRILKSKSGITLIALVVTIIVLIILAGISINLLLGDNGILKKAKDSASEQEIGQRKEAVSMAVTAEFANKNGEKSLMTVEGVLKELQKAQGSTSIYAKKGETEIRTIEGSTSLENGVTFVFPTEINTSTKGDIEVVVNNNMEITSVTTNGTSNSENQSGGNNNIETIPSEVTASVISSARNKSDYYGKTVNYSANGVTDWKIFYSDESNIYLISSDYVENSKLPTEAAEAITYPGRQCSFYWNPAPDSAQSPILSGKSWNTWTDYSTYKNGRTVSTLLNTSNWDNFKNSYAEYAIGGSTLEMWVASINEKYPNEKQLGIYKGTYGIAPTVEDGGEYFNGIPYAIHMSTRFNGINHAASKDSLYFPYEEMVSGCNNYWLASPGTRFDYGMIIVYVVEGNIADGNLKNIDVGVRPLVCLKSEITLTSGTGGYNFDLNL